MVKDLLPKVEVGSLSTPICKPRHLNTYVPKYLGGLPSL